MNSDTIIGYIAPFDMYGDAIKKGDIITRCCNQKMYQSLKKNESGISSIEHLLLPKEIVENWQPVYPLPRPIGEELSIVELEKERLEWSLKTFPETTAYSSLQKLKEEIKEIESDISKNHLCSEEYVDALMCLFDSAGRQGLSVEEIIEAFAIKLKINKSREWIKNPDNTYSHKK